MECGPFFALLRSFAELRPIQLERAQENIHDHLQRNLLHQALADQQAVRPDYPDCLPPRSFIGVSPMANSDIAVAHAAKHSTRYTKPH